MSDGEGQFTNDIMQVLSLTDQPAYEYIMKWWGPMDKWNICPTIDGKPSMKADTCPLPRPLGFSISIWLLPQCYPTVGTKGKLFKHVLLLWLPSGNLLQFAIENDPVRIVDLPIFPH